MKMAMLRAGQSSAYCPVLVVSKSTPESDAPDPSVCSLEEGKGGSDLPVSIFSESSILPAVSVGSCPCPAGSARSRSLAVISASSDVCGTWLKFTLCQERGRVM